MGITQAELDAIERGSQAERQLGEQLHAMTPAQRALYLPLHEVTWLGGCPVPDAHLTPGQDGATQIIDADGVARLEDAQVIERSGSVRRSGADTIARLLYAG